ncbi:MAG: hypothetical protein U1F43_17680 [Myxococcota bacterium]
MGLGLVERVKQTFAKKQAAPAQQSNNNNAERDVLGSMTFDQASAMVVPDGAMDRARRPPPLAKGPPQKQAQPDVQGALAIARSVAQKKVAASDKKGQGLYMTPPVPQAQGAAKKAQPPQSIYMNGPGAPANAHQGGAQKVAPVQPPQQAPQAPQSMYMNGPGVGPAPQSMYMNGPGVAPAHAPAQPQGPELYQNESVAPSEEAPAEGGAFYEADESVAESTQVPTEARAPEQVDSPMEVASQVLPDDEQEQIAELAVRMPPPQALEARHLEALRDASRPDAEDPARVGLTEDEQHQQGWALLPIFAYQKRMDEGLEGFTTEYDYADQEDLAKNRGGTTQTTKRNDYIVELRDGKFVQAKTGEKLESSDLSIPGALIANTMKEKKAQLGRALTHEEKVEVCEELKQVGGRYIFVMDASGGIYAGENVHQVRHHSSFMGGGAVAAAGELIVSGGTLKLISNQSGHYQPGPGYLWQAIVQMASQGVDMSGVTAQILGVGDMNAREFMEVFNPIENPALMTGSEGVAYLKSVQKGEIKPGKQAKPDLDAPKPLTGPEGKKEMEPRHG